MKIKLAPSFERSYKRRIRQNKKLDKRAQERIELFINNPQNPLLSDHQLKGTLEKKRAFSITGDVRIIYILENDVAYLVDIGTHNQVY